MTGSPRPRPMPSVTLLVTLGLAALYLLVFLPLDGRVTDADKPLVGVWDRFLTAAKSSEACAGVDFDGFPLRLGELREASTNLQGTEALVRARIGLPGEVSALMREPFQLVDFQIGCQRSADSLWRLGKERGVVFQGGLTNRLAEALGLSEYSSEMVDPALLWARLHVASQVIRTAIGSKLTAIGSLIQLPTVSYRSQADGAVFLEEVPMRLELIGSLDSAKRFLCGLPLLPAELGPVIPEAALTNKTAMFINRLLLRTYAPPDPKELPRPGEVILDVTLSAFVPLRGGETRSPAAP